jgi:hypothetical protein
MEDHSSPPPRIDDSGGPGEVTVQTAAMEGVGVGSAEVQDLISEMPLTIIGELDRCDLSNWMLEVRAHPGKLSPKVDNRLDRETDLVEGGLGQDRSGECAPQIGSIRRWQLSGLAPQQPSQSRQPNDCSIDYGWASLAARR